MIRLYGDFGATFIGLCRKIVIVAAQSKLMHSSNTRNLSQDKFHVSMNSAVENG